MGADTNYNWNVVEKLRNHTYIAKQHIAVFNEVFAYKHLEVAYEAYNDYLKYCTELKKGQVPNIVKVLYQDLEEMSRSIGKH